MKNKLFKALKQTYASLGLGDTILQGQAASLEATGLVTESNLDAVVSAQKQFLKVLQSGIDKRVADALNKANKTMKTKKTVDRHIVRELIDENAGEKVTAFQNQFRKYTKGACEPVPAYSITSTVKEHDYAATPGYARDSVTYTVNDSNIKDDMSGARHINAADGLYNKPSFSSKRNKPGCMKNRQSDADDGYHVLQITEKMIHSEFKKVLMNLIRAYE